MVAVGDRGGDAAELIRVKRAYDVLVARAGKARARPVSKRGTS